MPTARDLMATELIVLAPDMSVQKAMNLFLDNDISGAPVVDAHGSVVGILTERDCLQVLYAASYHRDPGGTVAEHMTARVETLDADLDIVDVMERFLLSRYRRFPVLSGTHLVGVISRRDILRSVLAMW